MKHTKSKTPKKSTSRSKRNQTSRLNHKNYQDSLFLIKILFVIIIVLVAIYLLRNSIGPNSNQQTQSSPDTSQAQTQTITTSVNPQENWQDFTSPQLGVALKLPPEISADIDQTSASILLYHQSDPGSYRYRLQTSLPSHAGQPSGIEVTLENQPYPTTLSFFVQCPQEGSCDPAIDNMRLGIPQNGWIVATITHQNVTWYLISNMIELNGQTSSQESTTIRNILATLELN